MIDPKAASASTASPADYEGRFAVTSSLEIGQILQALARRAILLTAYPDGGGDFFLTSVVAVDAGEGHLWLDTTAGDHELERVLRARGFTCVGSLDKVQIQFACSGIEDAAFDGRPVLRAALPDQLTRLQRREHFRIQTPLTAPPKCVVTVVRDGRPVRLELPVADISCGGVALVITPGQFDPEPGTSYPCTIALPGGSGLAITIEAHHTHIVRGAHGKETLRSGFSFINPPGPMVTAIQRYIMQLERERRTKIT